MKKLLSCVVVVLMVAALTVSALAYNVTTNTSDTDNNGKAIEECTLTGDWYSDKFVTNWKDSAAWNAFIEAMNGEGAVLTITCDGNVTKVGFQTSVGNVEVAVETVDGVATIAAADVLTACAECLDGYDWANFMISGDAGTTITSIEISNGEQAVPTEDETASVEDANTEAPADETVENTETADETTPAETGIALAVIPMAVAAAAVVASKRR